MKSHYFYPTVVGITAILLLIVLMGCEENFVMHETQKQAQLDGVATIQSMDGNNVLLLPVDFSAEGRPEFINGSISFDEDNLIIEFTAVDQNAKPGQTNKYTGIWFDKNILDKLPSTSYDDFSFVLVNNWFMKSLDDPTALSWRYSFEGGGNPWGGWSGAPPRIYSNHPDWPEGLSFDHEIDEDNINWVATVPLSLLGVEAGDTFGMIVQARDQNTDLSPALSLNSWPALEYGSNAPYDLRNYALVSIPIPNPTTIDDCKKGGWQKYGFRNQGLCIQFVNTGRDSR